MPYRGENLPIPAAVGGSVVTETKERLLYCLLAVGRLPDMNSLNHRGRGGAAALTLRTYRLLTMFYSTDRVLSCPSTRMNII
jgi:hypothetical protein